MADGRCKDCKYWRPFEADPDADPEVNASYEPYRREARADRRRLGLCEKASTYEHEKGSLAIAVDGSDYRYDLRTDATFGCVQFERAERSG